MRIRNDEVSPLWPGSDVVDTLAFLKSTGIWHSLLRDAENWVE
jgi:hypothetical protein